MTYTYSDSFKEVTSRQVVKDNYYPSISVIKSDFIIEGDTKTVVVHLKAMTALQNEFSMDCINNAKYDEAVNGNSEFGATHLKFSISCERKNLFDIPVSGDLVSIHLNDCKNDNGIVEKIVVDWRFTHQAISMNSILNQEQTKQLTHILDTTEPVHWSYLLGYYSKTFFRSHPSDLYVHCSCGKIYISEEVFTKNNLDERRNTYSILSDDVKLFLNNNDLIIIRLKDWAFEACLSLWDVSFEKFQNYYHIGTIEIDEHRTNIHDAWIHNRPQRNIQFLFLAKKLNRFGGVFQSVTQGLFSTNGTESTQRNLLFRLGGLPNGYYLRFEKMGSVSFDAIKNQIIANLKVLFQKNNVLPISEFKLKHRKKIVQDKIHEIESVTVDIYKRNIGLVFVRASILGYDTQKDNLGFQLVSHDTHPLAIGCRFYAYSDLSFFCDSVSDSIHSNVWQDIRHSEESAPYESPSSLYGEAFENDSSNFWNID